MFKKKPTTIDDVINYLKDMTPQQITALLETVELYQEAEAKKAEIFKLPQDLMFEEGGLENK